MKLLLTCKQASLIISISIDNKLSLSDHLKLKFHFIICDACKRFNQQLRFIKTAIQQIKHQTENDSSIQLSLDAKAKIKSVVEAKAVY